MDQISSHRENIQFEEIAIQIMRTLRGTETQIVTSRALGYSFNQMAKWESGEKIILLCDFLKMLLHKGLSPSAILQPTFPRASDEAHQTKVLIQNLQKDQELSRFAANIRETPAKISKWLSGEAEIPLSAFLKAIHRTNGPLLELVSKAVPLHHIPALKAIEPSLTEKA